MLSEEQFQSKYCANLNAQQAAAVRAVSGPVLLLAVPGSGKTTVLVTRLGYMRCVRGIAPGRILTMTYTVAATEDMRSRYAQLFGQEEADQMEFRTINGVCSRIIRLYERELDRRAFSLLTDGKRKSAILSALYHRQTEEFATQSILRSLETAISYAKNQMLSDQELAQLKVETLDFARFFKDYDKALRSMHLMDYDDQMVYALRILKQYPRILELVQQTYDYFCMDEAQDTSKIQHNVVHLLAGKKSNLFMVGDEDQSIYGFRAAYPQALMEFESVYPDARVMYMEQNYRSTRQIVAAANQFIAKNVNRHPKCMVATQGDGPEVRRIPVHDRQKQYPYLAQLARDCRRETAVLFRDNICALPLIDLLSRGNIPYRCREVDSLFFSSRVVQDFRSAIRLAEHPEDGEAFLSLYYKFGTGVSKALAAEAAQQAAVSGVPVLKYIAGKSGVPQWIRERCAELQDDLRRILNRRGDGAVALFLHDMKYIDWMRKSGQDTGRAEILKILGTPHADPGALLNRLDELQDIVKAGSRDPDSSFLLSTIHSSKGLEYEQVILMDVMDGILPKTDPAQALSEEELLEYEEERRLFYVAMTRAKRELSLFSFRSAAIHSTFTEELFPDRHRPPGAPARREPVRIPRWKKKVLPTEDYRPGVRVMHRAFGPGILTARNGDIVTIAFESGQTKKLSLSTLLNNGHLSLPGSGEREG